MPQPKKPAKVRRSKWHVTRGPGRGHRGDDAYKVLRLKLFCFFVRVGGLALLLLLLCSFSAPTLLLLCSDRRRSVARFTRPAEELALQTAKDAWNA